jgi:hypothetical protein
MEEDCGGGQGLSWAVEPVGGGEVFLLNVLFVRYWTSER